MHIKRVRIYFSLLDLIFSTPLEALREIRIENTALVIDTEMDKDLIDLIANPITNGEERDLFLPSITLSGRNLSLTLITPDNKLVFNKIFFSLSEKTGEYDVRGRAALNIAFSKPIEGISNINTEVNISGSVKKDFSTADVKIKSKQLNTNLFQLKGQTFQAAFREKTFRVIKIQDRAPIDIQGFYNISTGKIELSFLTDRFKPSLYLTLQSGLRQYAPWLSTEITGRGSVVFQLDTGKMDYSAIITARGYNKTLSGPFLLSASLKGNETLADFAYLSLKTDPFSIDFFGSLDLVNLYPRGRLDLKADIQERELTTTLFVTQQEDTHYIYGQFINYGETRIQNLIASVYQDKPGFEYRITGEVFNADSPGPFTLEGNFQPGKTPFLQLSASIIEVPLIDVYKAAVKSNNTIIENTLASLRLSTELYISTDFSLFSFSSSDSLLEDFNNRENRLIFSVYGSNSGINLSALSLNWQDTSVEGSGSLAINSDSYTAAIGLNLGSIPYNLEGLYVPNQGFFLSGTYGIEGSMLFKNNGIAFTLETLNLPIPFISSVPSLSLNISGNYYSRDKWEIYSYNSRISDLPYPRGENSIALTGRFSPEESIIQHISYMDSVSYFRGNGLLAIDSIDRGRGTAWLSLENTETQELLEARADFSGPFMDASAVFKNINFSRIPDVSLAGHGTGSVKVIGILPNPDIYLNLEVPDGIVNSRSATFQGAFSLTEERISIDRLSATYGINKINDLYGSLQFATGAFNAEGNYQGILGEGPVSAKISIDGYTEKGYERFSFYKGFADFIDSTIKIENIIIKNEKREPWIVSLKMDPQSVNINGGPSDSLSGYFSPDGNFILELRKPLPLNLYAAGLVRDGLINARVDNIVLDLKTLSDFIAIPEFAITAGSGTGNLRITGPISNPDFYGTLYGANAYSATRFIPERIGPYNAVFVVEGKTMQTKNAFLRTESGKAEADVILTIDNWVPRGYDVRIRTVDSKGIPVQYLSSGINAHGYAVGELAIYEINNGTWLGGDFVVHSCIINLGDRDETPPKGNVKNNELIVELNLTTGKRVEFLWPTPNFPILRAYADTEQVISIKYEDLSGNLSVEGNVNVKGGEILYFKRNFYLKEGNIVFRETQDQFDPVLTAKAEIREITDTGEPVKIYLLVEREPLSRFSPRFISDPYLPDEVILAMLGANIYSELGGQNLSLTSAAVLAGDLVGQFSVIRVFEQRVKDIFNLDLFSVRTEIIQTLLQERVFARDENPIFTGDTGLGRYLDNTTIFLGKYFGNDIFLEALFRINANTQLVSSYRTANNFTIDSELSLEWKTPLFLMDITYAPDLTNFRDTFYNFSLGLSWDYSF